MQQTFAEMLSDGGKSNSLGRTGEVIEVVLYDKDRLDELYDCVFNDNAWIRMRAIDALEKICRQHPEWLEPYIDKFQSLLNSSNQPSILWHLAQIYSQVRLTPTQKRKAISWLKELLSTTNVDWIVAANAMKTLVQFTNDSSVPIDDTVRLLTLQRGHKSNSVVKKANQLLVDLSPMRSNDDNSDTKRIIIVHGYTNNPKDHWFPWLKKKLENQNINVNIPAMPTTFTPKLQRWLPHLQHVAGDVDVNTFLVGHSLGCATILRFLEALPSDQRIGGVILVAGFAEPMHFHELDGFTIGAWNDKKIRASVNEIVLINSDNDEHVPLEMGERMRDRFNAKLIVLNNAGHINDKSGHTTAPFVLHELERMMK